MRAVLSFVVVVVGCGPVENSGVCVEGCGVDADSPTLDAAPDAPTSLVAMVEIPAGPFLRGCNGSIETCSSPEEQPSKVITLSAYYLDETEVTQYAYQECVTAGVCAAPNYSQWSPITTPLHPVAAITWTEARDYCTWRGKRLPTEAEWEKAARGVNGATYPWGNAPAAPPSDACRRAHFRDCVFGGEHPLAVAQLVPGDSPFRVHDLAGNVFELVADFWDPNYYTIAPGVDPKGPATGTEHDPGAGLSRVARGGGWGANSVGDGRFLRAAARLEWSETSRSMSVGFRCALTK